MNKELLTIEDKQRIILQFIGKYYSRLKKDISKLIQTPNKKYIVNIIYIS